MSREANLEENWKAAWEKARATLEGVTRHRVRGSEPDVEIAFLDWGGRGELVLLHHANGFCGATLAPIASALRNRYRVVSIDARGHGDSTAVSPGGDPSRYAWRSLAADLRAAIHEILELIGRDRVELAIGHSFGGALLIESAEKEPSLFGTLLLCDPVLISTPRPGKLAPVSGAPSMADGARRRRSRFPTLAEAFGHFQTRGLFAQFTPDALALYVGEGLRETTDGDFSLKCDPEVEAAIFSDSLATDLFAEAEALSANVLVLHALKGNFSRERYDDLTGRMPNARVTSLDVGHLFPMEEPDRVLSAVEDLMSVRQAK